MLLGVHINNYVKADRDSLRASMAAMRKRAKDAGLTEEILESLLEDE
jgi:hypothetical protein